MVTATTVKALHVPYPTPAPTHTHTGPCPPRLYLTLLLWLISAPRSNSTSAMDRCPFPESWTRAVLPDYTT